MRWVLFVLAVVVLSACVASETPATVATTVPITPVLTTAIDQATTPEKTSPETTLQTLPDIRTLDRDGLIQRWADDRAAAVARIVESGWGVDDGNVLQGPGGMQIDLNDCPSGWTDAGPAPTAASIPLSWWEYYHGPGTDQAYDFLEWLGSDGYVDGRPLDLTAHMTYNEWDVTEAAADSGSGLEPTKPGSDLDVHNAELVAEAASEAFAVVGLIGWSQTDGFIPRFDRACLPSIGRRGGSDRAGAGETPWSVPSLDLQYPEAGQAFARYAQQHLSDQRVGLMIMDNSFGDILATPLLDLGAAGKLDVVSVRHDPAANEALMGSAIDELITLEPEIVIAATAGNPCFLLTTGVEERRPEMPVILPEVCSFTPAYLTPADDAADGVLTLLARIEATADPLSGSALGDLADELYGQAEHRSRNTAEWPLIWQTVQLLQIAAELPGGLTRSNVILAGWSFDGHCPQMEARLTTNWPDDLRMVDGVRLHRFDAEVQDWQPTQTLIDLSRDLSDDDLAG